MVDLEYIWKTMLVLKSWSHMCHLLLKCSRWYRTDSWCSRHEFDWSFSQLSTCIPDIRVTGSVLREWFLTINVLFTFDTKWCVHSKKYFLVKHEVKIGYYLGFMTYIGCFTQKSMVSSCIVSYLLVYTWHTPLHCLHGANARCDLAGVVPVYPTTWKNDLLGSCFWFQAFTPV